MDNVLSKGRFAVPVERGLVAQEWRSRGYTCDLFVDPPGRSWNDFVHANNELVAVAEGCLEVQVGDVRLIAEPGDEIFIPRGVSHSVRNIHDDTTRWLFGFDNKAAQA